MVSYKLQDVERPAKTRRESTKYPGTSLELTTRCLTFRDSRTCEVFALAGGQAELIACWPESRQDRERFAHICQVAQSYAAMLWSRRPRAARSRR